VENVSFSLFVLAKSAFWKAKVIAGPSITASHLKAIQSSSLHRIKTAIFESHLNCDRWSVHQCSLVFVTLAYLEKVVALQSNCDARSLYGS
jgi:hypothetical protein